QPLGAAASGARGRPVGLDVDVLDEEHTALVDPLLERILEGGVVLPPEALRLAPVVVAAGGREPERRRGGLVVRRRILRPPLQLTSERALLERGALEGFGGARAGADAALGGEVDHPVAQGAGGAAVVGVVVG